MHQQSFPNPKPPSKGRTQRAYKHFRLPSAIQYREQQQQQEQSNAFSSLSHSNPPNPTPRVFVPQPYVATHAHTLKLGGRDVPPVPLFNSTTTTVSTSTTHPILPAQFQNTSENPMAKSQERGGGRRRDSVCSEFKVQYASTPTTRAAPDPLIGSFFLQGHKPLHSEEVIRYSNDEDEDEEEVKIVKQTMETACQTDVFTIPRCAGCGIERARHVTMVFSYDLQRDVCIPCFQRWLYTRWAAPTGVQQPSQ